MQSQERVKQSEINCCAVRTKIRAMLGNRKVRSLLQVLFSLSLLAWLIGKVGPQSIAETLARVDWAWYLPALFLFSLNVFIRAYRWHILLRSLNDRSSFLQLVYLYYLGFFFDNFIPSGFGGDVVKVLSLRQEHGHGAEALSSVMMDRLTGLLGSTLLAILALGWNLLRPWLGENFVAVDLPQTLIAAIAVVSLGIPTGFVLLRWSDPLGWLATHLPFTRRLTAHSSLQRLAETIRRYPVSSLLQALLTSMPFTVILVLIQYCIACSLAIDVPFYLFLLFVPIISIINLLPISFHGLGVREGAYQLLFVPVGVSSAEAIAMSLCFYFLRVVAGLIGGLIYALRGLLGLGERAGKGR